MLYAYTILKRNNLTLREADFDNTLDQVQEVDTLNNFLIYCGYTLSDDSKSALIGYPHLAEVMSDIVLCLSDKLNVDRGMAYKYLREGSDSSQGDKVDSTLGELTSKGEHEVKLISLSRETIGQLFDSLLVKPDLWDVDEVSVVKDYTDFPGNTFNTTLEKIPITTNALILASLLYNAGKVSNRDIYELLLRKGSAANYLIFIRFVVDSESLLDLDYADKTRFTLANKPNKTLSKFILSTLDDHFKTRFSSEFLSTFKYNNSLWRNLCFLFHIKSTSKRYPHLSKHVDSIFSNNIKGPYSYFYANLDSIGDDLNFLNNNSGLAFRNITTIAKSDESKALEVLGRVVNQVPTKALIQFYNGLLNQGNIPDYRVKGLSNIKVLGVSPRYWGSLDFINNCKFIISSNVKERLGNLPDWGDVYMDPVLRGVTVPTHSLLSSSSFSSPPPGTRIGFELSGRSDLRYFMFWEGDGVDLDLSVSYYSVDYVYNPSYSVYYLSLVTELGKHSGDIVDGSGGAIEYIDINNSFIQREKGFVVPSVILFSPGLGSDLRTIADLPHASIGWLSSPDSIGGYKSRLYQARDCEHNYRVMSLKTSVILPFLDLSRREVVFETYSMGHNRYSKGLNLKYGRNIQSEEERIGGSLKVLSEKKYLLLYDLLNWRNEVHGNNFVDKPDKAGTIVSSSYFDSNRIMEDFGF